MRRPAGARPRVVIAPDSFKGSLPAKAVALAMAEGLARGWPEALPVLVPMADGGEGTLDVLLELGRATCLTRVVTDALGRPAEVRAAILQDLDGPWAVLESAAVLGLPEAPGSVDVRHSGGLGLLLRGLLREGHRRFLIALGGTSIVDGGAGLLDALGARFLDTEGRVLRPFPRALMHMDRMVLQDFEPLCAQARIVVLTDVENPLLGPLGAVACYGLQKGIVAEEAADFEEVLTRLSDQYRLAFGRPVADCPGGGSAGGLGAALAALGATLLPGAAEIAERLGLPETLMGAAWALTGEGRADRQTMQGKAPWQVAMLARGRGVPVSLISGVLDPVAHEALRAHFGTCHGLSPGPVLSPAETTLRLIEMTASVARMRARGLDADT